MDKYSIYKTLGLSLCLTTLALSLGACSSIGQQQNSNQSEQTALSQVQDINPKENALLTHDTFSLERLWHLRELEGKALPDSLQDISLNIQVKAGKVNGMAGCNRFFATLQLGEKDSIRIANIGSTRMACPDLNTEYNYLQALERVQHYYLDSDKSELLLSDKDGKALLRFE